MIIIAVSFYILTYPVAAITLFIKFISILDRLVGRSLASAKNERARPQELIAHAHVHGHPISRIQLCTRTAYHYAHKSEVDMQATTTDLEESKCMFNTAMDINHELEKSDQYNSRSIQLAM